jgi:hypothetical protein
MKLLSMEDIDARLDKILPELPSENDVEAYMKTFGIDRVDAVQLCRISTYDRNHGLMKISDTTGNEYMKTHAEYLELSKMVAEHNRQLNL